MKVLHDESESYARVAIAAECLAPRPSLRSQPGYSCLYWSIRDYAEAYRTHSTTPTEVNCSDRDVETGSWKSRSSQRLLFNNNHKGYTDVLPLGMMCQVVEQFISVVEGSLKSSPRMDYFISFDPTDIRKQAAASTARISLGRRQLFCPSFALSDSQRFGIGLMFRLEQESRYPSWTAFFWL